MSTAEQINKPTKSEQRMAIHFLLGTFCHLIADKKY
jgi:hypothetical protein